MSDDEVLSESGGSMVRLVGAAPDPGPLDLSVLESLRTDPGVPAGDAPYLTPGQSIVWRYHLFADAMVVVRDDARGLVAWLPAGSERLTVTARDGLGLRDRTLEERARMAVDHEYDVAVGRWQGDGILRVGPTGAPWSVWWFFENGEFAGHYLNLELAHHRPADGSPRTLSRDLTLDLWLEPGGDLWLKDADELEAFTAAGRFTPEQAAIISGLADRVRRELIEPRAWPLDEGWESWRPPASYDVPQVLPDDLRALATR